MREPARVRKLVILNAPHPALFRRELRKGRQALRSWYAGFFQLPFLPELVLSSFHFRLLTRGAARTQQEREIYEEALSQAGGLTSALNYYRAAFRGMVGRHAVAATPPISQKTLVLWGERDRALDQRVLHGLERYVPNVELIRFRDTGHWIHIDAPERVNEELLRFLKS
jgi:pimeloyl-ACP methyl ester carboxylesterase